MVAFASRPVAQNTLPINALFFPRFWNPCRNVIGLVITTEVLRSLLMIGNAMQTALQCNADCPTNHA